MATTVPMIALGVMSTGPSAMPACPLNDRNCLVSPPKM